MAEQFQLEMSEECHMWLVTERTQIEPLLQEMPAEWRDKLLACLHPVVDDLVWSLERVKADVVSWIQVLSEPGEASCPGEWVVAEIARKWLEDEEVHDLITADIAKRVNLDMTTERNVYMADAMRDVVDEWLEAYTPGKAKEYHDRVRSRASTTW